MQKCLNPKVFKAPYHIEFVSRESSMSSEQQRKGGRSARRLLRSTPIPDDERPVRPGHFGGRYQPLSKSDIDRIHIAVLDALEADHEFLLKGDVFTPDLIEAYIGYKRENEVDPVRLRTHPHEFTLYYDA